MLAREMNTTNERSEINYTVTQKEPQATSNSTTANLQAKHHAQQFTLARNYPILDNLIQQEPSLIPLDQSGLTMDTKIGQSKFDNPETQIECQVNPMEKPGIDLFDVKNLESPIWPSEIATPPTSDQNFITTGKNKDTGEPKKRWILIKRCDGLGVRATSANFDSWEVTNTGANDKEYPPAKQDIQAYEVFEQQEPGTNRRIRKAAPQPGSIGTRTSNIKTFEAKTDNANDNLDNDDKSRVRNNVHPNLHNNISLTSITEGGADMLESNIKAPIITAGQSTMDNWSEVEMLALTIKASTKEDNEGIERATKASLEDTAEKVGKAFPVGTPRDPSRATPSQMDVQYDEMIELAIQTSIQEMGIPIFLDDALNAQLSDIRIPNIDDSCYIVNGVIALATTLEGLALTSAQCSETDRPRSELLRIIDTELLQPIRSVMTHVNTGRALHISGTTIQNIRNACQQRGWTNAEGQHCISEFLAFLSGAFGIADHSIETITQAPNRLDETLKGRMGTLHLSLPPTETQSDTISAPVELTYLIQKTFLPDVNDYNVTTTVNIQKLSDTLIIHAERVLSG
jgi:hypothetical protein